MDIRWRLKKSEKDEKFPIEYEIEKNKEKINEKIKNEEYYLKIQQ